MLDIYIYQDIFDIFDIFENITIFSNPADQSRYRPDDRGSTARK